MNINYNKNPLNKVPIFIFCIGISIMYIYFGRFILHLKHLSTHLKELSVCMFSKLNNIMSSIIVH